MPNNDPMLSISISAKGAKPPQGKQELDTIVHAPVGLCFGSIEIIVHEGRVTQIERKGKFRLH